MHLGEDYVKNAFSNLKLNIVHNLRYLNILLFIFQTRIIAI